MSPKAERRTFVENVYQTPLLPLKPRPEPYVPCQSCLLKIKIRKLTPFMLIKVHLGTSVCSRTLSERNVNSPLTVTWIMVKEDRKFSSGSARSCKDPRCPGPNIRPGWGSG